jgi:hypothetical protein
MCECKNAPSNFRDAFQPTSSQLSSQSPLFSTATTININDFKMSSPGHRRQRSSQSATPKRSSQRNAVASSPPDPAASQLQNEAASSQKNSTPRRAPPSSSPMNYRSSPAELARANRDVSSPLRQMSNTQTTQDGDRTPRPSGLITGKNPNQSILTQTHDCRIISYQICKLQPQSRFCWQSTIPTS